MVRFGVGLIAIALILFSFEQQLMNSSMSMQEESWISTGLKTQDIANFYQNFNCKSTQKTYLACVNSLKAMSNYMNLNLKWSEPDGLGFETRKMINNQSEKVRLTSWLNLYKSNKYLSMDFEKAWKDIETKIKSHHFSSYIVGLGINNYLSIHRDPHSYILPREYYEKVVANSKPRMNSYGFNLGKSEKEFVFARIYPGSLFDKLGVNKGDVILEIDGKDISKMQLEVVSDWLKSKDKHRFKVRLSNHKIATWVLDKKDQVLPAVSIKQLQRTNDKNLHLISIFKISEGVCESVKSSLRQAVSEKTNGVIVDLRDNSGGSMDEILCLSGLFVGEKKIYDLVYFNKRYRKETFFSEQSEEYFGPLVILVNRATASSAEILAGVIQHYGRGLLIGERTFGKGSFQEGEEWPKNKRLLYFQTRGTFHLPSGRSPQLIGITPDVQVAESFASLFQREEELYLYPIGNREVREKVSKRTASVQECGSVKNEILTADRLLGKALGHIDCIQF